MPGSGINLTNQTLIGADLILQLIYRLICLGRSSHEPWDEMVHSMTIDTSCTVSVRVRVFRDYNVRTGQPVNRHGL